MKRILIFVLVLLPMLAFSQMQNIISQGNTATTLRQIPYSNNITIDSNLIRIRSIDKNNLVTSIPIISTINGQGTIFLLSTTGTTTVIERTLSNATVHDFQIFGGIIYFCGESSAYGGFIGWTTIANLFSSTPSPITIQKIEDPIKTIAVKELEVYSWNDSIHVAALADNRYLIDMNTANPSTYQIMESKYAYRRLSVGKDKIAAIETHSDTSIVVTAFDAGNISQYTYQGFTHPELRYDNYVLENSKLNANAFTFAYTHRKITNNTWYKTDFITFDATAGINIVNDQCLEVPEAKLEPIDLEYCPEDNSLLYLAGGHHGFDEIFPIEPFLTNTYVSISIQPDTLINKRIKQYNSIIRYEDYYYATVSKYLQTNRVITFDCNRNSTAPLNCAISYNENVFNYSFLNSATINPAYIYHAGQQVTDVVNVTNSTKKYSILCQ
ncbi:MAG: hypothetical protein J6U84_05770 [Bacteroidales bacterium]|nr:hypothetical protein [Bacteroidales bacterium]